MKKLIVSFILVLFLIVSIINISNAAPRISNYKPPAVIKLLNIKQAFIDGCMVVAYSMNYQLLKVPPNYINTFELHDKCAKTFDARTKQKANIYQLLGITPIKSKQLGEQPSKDRI